MWYRSRTIISMVTVTLGLAFPLAACAGGSGGAEEQPSPTSIASSSAQAAPAPSPPAVPSARPQARFNTTEVGGFAFAAGSAWMADGATLLRIDPHTNQTIAKIRVGPDSRFVYAVDGTVWVSSGDGSYRVDPASNAVTEKLPAGVVFGYGSLWAMDASGNLLRIDATTGKTLGKIKVQGPVDWQPQLAVGFGSVWVGSGDEHRVIRVDPETMKIETEIGGISTDYSLLPVGTGFGSVWAQANAAGGSGILYRIDPTTNKVIAAIHVGNRQNGGQYGGTDIAFADGSVWTGDSSNTVTRVDPRKNRVVATVELVGLDGPEFVAVGYGSVWATSEQPVAARFGLSAWSGH